MLDNVLWYSRYAIWVGALVLLVQSITGRSVGLVTLFGVLLLAVGFAVFLFTLSWQGLPHGVTVPEEGLLEEGLAFVEEYAPSEVPAEPSAAFSAPPPAETSAVQAGTPEPPAEAIAEPASAPARVTVRTFRVVAGQTPAGACPACLRPMTSGQVASVCPECGTAQHASCWTEHGFACSVPECTGHGGLEAPEGA